MDFKARIESNPDVLLGKPVIKGTRISVEVLLEKLSEGASIPDLLVAYPHLTTQDVLAALSYASAILSKEELLAT